MAAPSTAPASAPMPAPIVVFDVSCWPVYGSVVWQPDTNTANAMARQIPEVRMATPVWAFLAKVSKRDGIVSSGDKKQGGAVGPAAERILRIAIAVVYGRRRLTFAVLMAFTAVMLVQALRIQPDAGFEKQIPLKHPFMQVFKKYEKAFGGANLITVALMQKDGDIYN